MHCSFLERRKNKNANGELPPCVSVSEKKREKGGKRKVGEPGWEVGGGEGGKKLQKKKKRKKKPSAGN